jgi:hypothetical protein
MNLKTAKKIIKKELDKAHASGCKIHSVFLRTASGKKYKISKI